MHNGCQYTFFQYRLILIKIFVNINWEKVDNVAKYYSTRLTYSIDQAQYNFLYYNEIRKFKESKYLHYKKSGAQVWSEGPINPQQLESYHECTKAKVWIWFVSHTSISFAYQWANWSWDLSSSSNHICLSSTTRVCKKVSTWYRTWYIFHDGLKSE